MNPTAIAPGSRPDFFVTVAQQVVQAPCHTYTQRQFWVPLCVWNGTAFGTHRNFLLDTGCDFCTVEHAFAVAHGFHLDRNCQISVGGLTGGNAAWLTRRYVRFQQLPTLRFSFHFLVPIPFSHPDHPRYDPNAPQLPSHPRLLGIADLLEAFELVVRARRVDFYRLPGQGAPITP